MSTGSLVGALRMPWAGSSGGGVSAASGWAGGLPASCLYDTLVLLTISAPASIILEPRARVSAARDRMRARFLPRANWRTVSTISGSFVRP